MFKGENKMKRIINYLLVLSLLVTCMVFASPQVVMAGTQATYYVSTTGDDDDPGTFAEPFLTIEHARDVVQTINSDMTGDIIVNLRGGTYTLDSALELTSADSGTNGYNVIYQNYAEETPIISGGVEVTDWDVYSGSIYRAYVGTGFYSRDFFVDGNRRTRAIGEQNPTGFSFNETYGFNLPGSGTYANMASWGNKSDIEIHQAQSFGCPWGSVDTIADGVITMKQPFWSTNLLLVSSALALIYPEYIENAYELLDAEGEWYLNRTDGYIYYIPVGAENPDNVTCILGKLEKLIDGNSGGDLDDMMNNISFSGITFAYTTYLQPLTDDGRVDHYGGIQFVVEYPYSFDVLSVPALDFWLSKNISILDCSIMHIGSSGIGFKLGAQDNILDNNYLYDIGINGINIGDIHYYSHYDWGDANNGLNELSMTDRDPTDSRCIVSGNQVTNNTITEVGSAIPSAIGVFGGFVKNTLIDHNTIHNVTYSGISVGYGWGYADDYADFDTAAIGDNTITYNKIYDHMKVLYDGGGIYTHGQCNGTLIKYNYVYQQHDLYALLYLDGGSTDISASDNVLSSLDGSCDNWVVLQQYYTGTNYWMQSTNNDVEYNYYSSDLTIMNVSWVETPAYNVVSNNISVSGSWDSHAQDIIDCSGAGGGTISTNNALRGINLALGETASASEYVGTNTAAMAIDGNTNTKWVSDSTTTAYLEVDFGSSTTFNTVVFREGLENGQNIKDYQIQYWDGDSWEDAYDSDASSPEAAATHVFTAVSANKVRLYISDIDGDGPSVLEFEVYNVTLASTYKIINRKSTDAPQTSVMFISPYNYSSSSVDLYQYANSTSSKQKWTFTSLGSGNYEIINVGSSKVITPTSYSTNEGITLRQQTWANHDTQKWQLIPTGDGYYKISNYSSSHLITPYQNLGTSVKIIQSTDAEGYDQQWSLDAAQ